MIPKVIHYCWFGRGEKPELAKKCIASWCKFLPDYEIKEWNENNFDINCNQYVKEAYESRKFAFVTDYVRLYAIYTEGGVYMDTDVEVLKTFDSFLHHHAFSGFETDGNVPTGMMAGEKGSIWAKDLLNDYSNRKFIQDDGTFDMRTNTEVITSYMLSKGLIQNNTYQDFPGLCTMYPSDFFCPKDHRTGKIKCTKNTVCIHHFAGSWLTLSFIERLRHKFKLLGVKVLGEKFATKASYILKKRRII
ncbi:MAG: glycosyl transferase [Muribaculaceae bacterium]|nr:glycosyl transferase [Muribaculaceae bacterium]